MEKICKGESDSKAFKIYDSYLKEYRKGFTILQLKDEYESLKRTIDSIRKESEALEEESEVPASERQHLIVCTALAIWTLAYLFLRGTLLSLLWKMSGACMGIFLLTEIHRLMVARMKKYKSTIKNREIVDLELRRLALKEILITLGKR